MKNTKKSFVLYSQWEKVFAKLTPEQQGNLIMYIFAYANRGELPTNVEQTVDVAFASMQDAMDENAKRYEETCKARSESGKKGGRPRKNVTMQDSWQPQEAKEATKEPETVQIPSVQSIPPQAEQAVPVDTMTAYGTHQWVKLTKSNFESLAQELGAEELARCIAYLDESAQITSNKNGWHDWAVTIQRCSRDQWGIHKQKKPIKQKKTVPMGSAGQGPLSPLEQKALEELQREYGLAHPDVHLYCKSDPTPNLPCSIFSQLQGGASHA